jgi:hypothetical protein
MTPDCPGRAVAGRTLALCITCARLQVDAIPSLSAPARIVGVGASVRWHCDSHVPEPPSDAAMARRQAEEQVQAHAASIGAADAARPPSHVGAGGLERGGVRNDRWDHADPA